MTDQTPSSPAEKPRGLAVPCDSAQYDITVPYPSKRLRIAGRDVDMTKMKPASDHKRFAQIKP